jgi:hypothetical protein
LPDLRQRLGGQPQAAKLAPLRIAGWRRSCPRSHLSPPLSPPLDPSCTHDALIRC